jgi:ABC-type polysaccharide/polyol phosphate export permease
LWGFFLETATGTIQILSTKKYLYEYTNMNKIEIYLSVIGSNLIGLLFNLLMFSLYFIFLEKGSTYYSWHIIFLPIILLNLIILSLGFSLILSTIYIFAKDIQQIWAIIANIGFWVSPILFSPDIFSTRLPLAKYLNPISSIVINAREVVMYHHLPDWKFLGWGYIYATFFLLIGVYLLNTLGSKAAEKL